MDTSRVGELVNWLNLPSHIQSLISDKLVYIKDYIRFGAVCHSWHSIHTQNRHRLSRPQLPMLIFPTEIINDYQKHILCDISEKRIHTFPSPLLLPHDKYRRGSSQGWLVYVSSQQVHLLNPFLLVDNKIDLPPVTSSFEPDNDDEGFDDDEELEYGIESCQGNYIYKAVLSGNPALNPNYVVMAAYIGYINLVFYKSGDNAWTFPVDNDDCVEIEDIIYYKDKFYAVDCKGTIWACDVSCSHPRLEKVAPLFDDKLSCTRKYLVESSGDLLQIRRILDWKADGNCNLVIATFGFEVFKLDQIAGKWVETKSLDRRMLFVGDNTSISLLASDFPGFKSNCIYFTGEGYAIRGRDRAEDMGVYDLEDGSVKPYYGMESNTITYPTCIWIEPTLPGGPN